MGLKFKSAPPPPPPPTTIEQALDQGAPEIVIDSRGYARQAGSEPTQEGATVMAMRAKAEASLYYFWKYVLALNRPNIISPKLHGWLCNPTPKKPHPTAKCASSLAATSNRL